MVQWMMQVRLKELEAPLVAGGILFTALRLFQAHRNSVAAKNNEPPVLPYWIPWLGHVLSFAVGSEKVFTAARYACVALIGGSLNAPF